MKRQLFAAITLLASTSCFATNVFAASQPGWRAEPALSVARAGAAVVTHNDTIYVIGGVDGRVFLRSVEFAKVDSNGNLGQWQRTSILPEARGFTDAFVANDHVYVVGGGNGKHGKNLLRTVARASIEADGQLGEWQTLPHTLNLPRRCAKVCYVPGRGAFGFGGFAGTLLDSIEVWPLLDDRSWQLLPQTLTVPRYVNASKLVNGRLYLLGGHHPEKGRGLVTVEYADMTNEQSEFSQTTAMQVGRYGLTAAATKDYLFAFGGISGSEYLASTEFAQFDSNGELSEWRFNTPLPEPLANFQTVVFKDRLWVLGGTGRQDYSSKTYSARIDANGWIGVDVSGARYVPPFNAEIDQVESNYSLSGEIREVIQTDDYSYLQVKTASGMMWLAVPQALFQVGETIQFNEGVYMSNFYSKQLDRKFSEIRFVGRVQTVKTVR